jgi:hypothetical protein
MAAHEVSSKIHEQDGIKYSLIVDEEDGWFWGVWICLPCNEKGESSKRCSSIEEAFIAAEANTQLHHAATHKPKTP